MIGKIYKPPLWLRKYLSKEDFFTIQCANFLKAHGFIFTHTFNEGKRSRTMRQKLVGFGVMTGIPDLMIFEPFGDYVGLAIELKVKYSSGAKNRLSESQKVAQMMLKSKGWKCVTVWNIDEFLEELKVYKNGG
jgi:hypothetical protein